MSCILSNDRDIFGVNLRAKLVLLNMNIFDLTDLYEH